MTASDIGVTNIFCHLSVKEKNPWPVLSQYEQPPPQTQNGLGWLPDAAFSPVR